VGGDEKRPGRAALDAGAVASHECRQLAPGGLLKTHTTAVAERSPPTSTPIQTSSASLNCGWPIRCCHAPALSERGVLREAAHPLEADPGLVAAGGADRDHRPGDRAEVMHADLRRERGLGVAARQDRADLAGRPEVRACDPLLVRVQRLADQLAELNEPREPG
jgi:hypothetical protein